MNRTLFIIQTTKIQPLPRTRRGRKRVRVENPEVRQRLLAAATALVEEQGFSQMRIDELAERAGLAVGTFYLYFAGKDDLYARIIQSFTEEFRQILRTAYQGEGSMSARLWRGLAAYLDAVEERPQLFLSLRDAASVRTNVGSLTSWAISCLAEELRPVLEEGMRNGECRQMDSKLLAEAILGQIYHSAGFWLENRETYSRSDLQRFLGDLIRTGLAA